MNKEDLRAINEAYLNQNNPEKFIYFLNSVGGMHGEEISLEGYSSNLGDIIAYCNKNDIENWEDETVTQEDVFWEDVESDSGYQTKGKKILAVWQINESYECLKCQA